MIFDTLDNSHQYNLGPEWPLICDFIIRLDPQTPDGKHDIPGTSAYAVVASYDTKIPDANATLEAHRREIDVQSALEGEEGFWCYDLNSLTIKTSYDPDRDATFYHPPQTPAPLQFSLKPGQFAVLFPQDAHMPKVSPDAKCSPVRKVVVKVPIETFTPAREKQG